MSIQSFLERIRAKLDELRREEATHGDLAHALQWRALEGLPNALFTQIEELAHEFQIAQWYVDEDCLPDTEDLIAQSEELIRKIKDLSAHR